MERKGQSPKHQNFSEFQVVTRCLQGRVDLFSRGEKTLLDARLYTSLPLPNEDILQVTGDVAPRNARPSAIFRFLLNGGPWKQVLTHLGCPPLGCVYFSNPGPFRLYLCR